MSAADLREMIEAASEAAENRFARKGNVPAVWSCFTANGEYMIIEPPHPDKDISAILVRALFELKEAVRCLFVDEAWTLQGGPDVNAWIAKHGHIHDHPGRVEVVAFMGEDAEGGMITAHRRIIRGQGKPTLGPLEFQDWSQGESSGRLVGMLPRRKASVQ